MPSCNLCQDTGWVACSQCSGKGWTSYLSKDNPHAVGRGVYVDCTLCTKTGWIKCSCGRAKPRPTLRSERR